jgi:hypothetical protein
MFPRRINLNMDYTYRYNQATKGKNDNIRYSIGVVGRTINLASEKTWGAWTR